ncbi:glycosyltransferase [Methylobacterium sp. NEAU 140]|uniref:glycosyltransferase n=1 Tax=Methylobacterium sp. NEAU 140 TaxID=3064945 RepID=UPI002732C5D2|nr:glycosyltransferase [Methylobacterium sp. NEAU 140]MDP4023556.1 glycosyltransferase [Methylobacterium sp. NEAU 140]
MSGRTEPDPGGPCGERHLGAPSRPWRGGLAALLRLARQPRGAGSVLAAWATGKRLRARQRLAALVGIDHRLALPAGTLDWFAPDAAAGHGSPGLRDDIALVGPGTLAAGAAARIAAALDAAPDVQAVYGDGLVQDRPGGPVLPLLPPAFDPELLRAVAYIDLLAYRRAALAGPAPTGAADAALRIAARHGDRAIGHLPGILSLRRPGPAGEGRAATRPDASGGVPDAAPDGRPRPADARPRTPRATAIVPTRDRLDLLRPCLDSLRTCTDWPDLEILVCDNGSREPETLAFLRDWAGAGRGVVPYPGPFNFAAMNNAAADRAGGDLLVFVNNDVEAFRPDWLRLMAREALRPDVGAVGAKLLDGAGRIQHGGIVLGTGGLVTHGHRHFPGDAPGYLAALSATHRVSAVTAACLAVEAEKFRRVGGFDAERFAVDFNDVDLCLRLGAAGLRTLLVPEAVLHHREAASRRWTPEAQGRHAREIAALKARWGPLLAQDPHYNPGFDPALSTHARLAGGVPASGPLRRPLY